MSSTELMHIPTPPELHDCARLADWWATLPKRRGMQTAYHEEPDGRRAVYRLFAGQGRTKYDAMTICMGLTAAHIHEHPDHEIIERRLPRLERRGRSYIASTRFGMLKRIPS